MSKKLFIDIYKCDECEKCTVECGYFYQPQITEHGILALREMISFLMVCRKCEEPSCIASCKFEALEKQEDNVLKRYNMRCVSCKCCSHACPFGTIYPETLPYYAKKCDYCVSSSNKQPACISSCVKNAIEFKEVEEKEEEGIYILNDNLAVKSPKWVKAELKR